MHTTINKAPSSLDSGWVWTLVLVLSVSTGSAAGQPAERPHQYGVKAGVVVSGYEGNDYRPYLGYEIDWLQDDAGTADVGFQFGFFYSRRLAGGWAVQPEAYLAQRGLHFYGTTLYNTAYHLSVYYLQVPVLVKYGSIYAGPYLATRLQARRTLEVWGAQDTASVPAIQRFDYGVVAGYSPHFSIGRTQLLVDVRIEIGLAKAMDSPDGYTRLREDPDPSRLLAFTVMTGLWR